ncbi:MAG: NAD(P)H-dependent glycerol-3-phosphate dehydrogenase, partial [Coriobacteriales bacterium]|nr:NAD(P)H-dependent glycerol-3-phosphate dehydrogenase [Coriobacteriales bacterium]
CLLTQVLEQELGNPARIAAISGPNHAEEVSRDIPSATVVASTDPACAAFFQELLMSPSLRVYTSHDVTGVEICAAAKNIVAIFNGASCALGYGDNTSAMIMTRGLAEMSRLVLALGGDPLTCQGLAGMGDLIATCTSRHSRNRSLGELIARGGTLEEFTARTHMVAEGANAAITVTDLAREHGVELPLAQALRAILWEGAAVEDVVYDLMMRPPKAEFAGLEE